MSLNVPTNYLVGVVNLKRGPKMESKRELLKQKIVELVKNFIETEGGISMQDLADLFGPLEIRPHPNRIISGLWEMPITFPT